MDIQLVAFDLDGTLAPSKSPLPKEMAEKLIALLDIVPVCIISGGNLPQFKMQVLSQLPSETNWKNLHLMPTCGTRYLKYSGMSLECVYENNIDDETRHKAMRVLKEEAVKLNLWEDNSYGDIIEDRGSQVTYSALGQQAPEHEKKMWDPSGQKRLSLRDAVAARLPELEVRAGGSTSIDITQKGIDKAYGMKKLSEETGIPLENMLFIGDRLDEGGNDYPVISTGAMTYAVDGWQQTVEKVDQVIKDLV